MFFAVFAVVVGACSPVPTAAPATPDDAVAAFAADGHSEDVAECIVGLVSGRIDPAALVGDVQLTEAEELALDEATTNCELASELLSSDPEPPTDLAFDAEPRDYGDDAALDRLWDACEGGLGEACDELWAEAPVGSNYERFGVTCGERFDVLNCTADMDESDDESSDADESDDDDAEASGS